MGTVWYDKMETHRLKCGCECEMSLPKHYRPVNDRCLAATSTVVYCCRFLFFTYLLLPAISHADTFADTLRWWNPEPTRPHNFDNAPTQPVRSTSCVSLDIRVVQLVSVTFVQFCTFMFTTKFACCVTCTQMP